MEKSTQKTRSRGDFRFSPLDNHPLKRPGQRGAVAPFLDGSPGDGGRRTGDAGGFGTRPYAGMGLDISQLVQAVPATLGGGRLIAAPTHRWETVCVPICVGNARHAVGAGPRPARVPSRKIKQDPLNPTGFPLLSVGAARSRPLFRVTGPAGDAEPCGVSPWFVGGGVRTAPQCQAHQTPPAGTPVGQRFDTTKFTSAGQRKRGAVVSSPDGPEQMGRAQGRHGPARVCSQSEGSRASRTGEA